MPTLVLFFSYLASSGIPIVTGFGGTTRGFRVEISRVVFHDTGWLFTTRGKSERRKAQSRHPFKNYLAFFVRKA